MNIESSGKWLGTILAVAVAGGGATVGQTLSGIEFIPLDEAAEAGLDRGVSDAVDAGLAVRETPAPSRRDDLPPVETEGWDLGASLSLAYDDNIFLSANNPREDVVLKITPRIAYAAGREGEPGAYLRLAYLPSAVVYAGETDENRIDHVFRIEGVWSERRSEIGASGSLRRLGDAVADTGVATDRTEYEAELRYAWKAREKITVESRVSGSGANYDQETLADSRLIEGGLALRYAYSPKTELGAVVSAGRQTVDGAIDQDVYRATSTFDWRPGEKWLVDAEVGLEQRDYSGGSDTFAVFDVGANWAMRAGTEWFVRAYRRQETSAAFAGQNIEITGLRGGVNQRLGNRWTAGLEAGFERASYRSVGGGAGGAGRRDEIVFIRPSLDYQLRDDFRVGFFYRFTENDSNFSTFGYEGNRFGVDMAYDF
jgi:hypothetical protein